MGDLQVCSTEDRPFPVPLSVPLRGSNPDPSSLGEESWDVAEKATGEVIWCIHPTLDTEEKRKDVIDYVQRLIRCSLGCEVFPYGSVPLKTYLPDGDIDLTALISPSVQETLAHDVLIVLQGEEHNENAEYEVKFTQFIDAEVKLVKCVVQDIVIDISFNQLGGLCTLCFLEQVDRLIGKDHLFKRSIILIKAWCYYESRILGAHHGLISTYALETLILYIFHLFHGSLNGPLAVLHKFLDYFSKFDWENYCISLKGPVRKSTLPDRVVEMPANVGDTVLLSEEFLRNCMDMFSVPSRGLETNSRAFPQKFLNIIDPLKENNNLGRSVHRGNFYRIRSAFKHGARKLDQILLLPKERTADEIKRFFSNTLERHGHIAGGLSLFSHSRTSFEEKIQLNLLNLDLDNNIPGIGDNELYRYSMKDDAKQVVSKMTCSTNGICVSGSDLGGEGSSRISDTSDFSPSSCDLTDSLSGLSYGAPYLSLSGSSVDNGKSENKMFCEELLEEKMGFDPWTVDEMDFDLWMEQRQNHLGAGDAVCSCINYHEGVSSSSSGISSSDATNWEDLALDFRERDLVDIDESPDTLNPLADLRGEYESHIRSLLYGQGCHAYALSAPVQSDIVTFPSQSRRKKLWDTVWQSMPFNTNGVYSGLTHTPMNNRKPSHCLGSDEKHKIRGTGTYIPNSSGCLCRGRSSKGKGRNQAPTNHRQLQRHTRDNRSAPTLPEKKSFEDRDHELPRAWSPESTHPASENSNSDGSSISSQKLVFGTLEHLAEELSQPALETCHSWGSTSSLVSLKVLSSKTVLGDDQERVARQSFQLKDEEDFPPLAV